jgi:hypothetical protein
LLCGVTSGMRKDIWGVLCRCFSYFFHFHYGAGRNLPLKSSKLIPHLNNMRIQSEDMRWRHFGLRTITPLIELNEFDSSRETSYPCEVITAPLSKWVHMPQLSWTKATGKPDVLGSQICVF